MKRFALAAVLLLAGCTTENAAMSERPPQGTPQRSAPGQSLGRIASSGAGKLAAAQAGNYMDAQETELRQRLRGVNVRRLGDDIVIVIGNDNLFDGGSAGVSSGADGIMDTIGDVLMHNNKTLVMVGGYSDTTGSADFNLKLSQARAQAIADMLIARGVDRARVTAQGFGETHLKIPTGDHVNEPRNRRVEIRITPHTG